MASCDVAGILFVWPWWCKDGFVIAYHPDDAAQGKAAVVALAVKQGPPRGI